MEKRIKYFTYYGDKDKDCPRSNSPAADTKIDYIIETLNKCGYSVDIISHSSVSVPGFYFKSKLKIKDNNTFRYFSCFGKSKSKILRIFNRWYLEILFFIWCLCNLEKGEQIIVYHSLGYASTFLKLKKIKDIRIVGEIEEIYQDVHPQSPKRSKNEYRFINSCSKYIFPTSYLNEKLNINKKPFVIVHGIYSMEQHRKIMPFDDGKIHVIYAGTLDPQKGGAAAAAAAAAHLSDNYHIHILGFGSEKQITAITQIVNTVNTVNANSLAEVTYDGYKQGEEFIRFLQKCQIGLSTQDPTAEFNETSFPSKILTYMSNGLKVVSIRIPAVECSAVGQSLFYYDRQEPEQIAKAIEHCSNFESTVNGRELLKKLDELFIKELGNLLDDVAGNK